MHTIGYPFLLDSLRRTNHGTKSADLRTESNMEDLNGRKYGDSVWIEWLNGEHHIKLKNISQMVKGVLAGPRKRRMEHPNLLKTEHAA